MLFLLIVGLILQAKIPSLKEEYNLLEAESERVKKELMREYEDAASTAARLETEMVQLKEMHTVKSKVRFCLCLV